MLFTIFNIKYLTKTVLLEQTSLPGPTWLSETIENMKNLKIDMTLNNIKEMSKQKWKKMIKDRLIESEIDTIQAERKNMSKGKHLGPPTMNTSKYLEVLQFEDAITTLKVRCGMSNVKMNYKNNHQSLTCDMCHTEAETTIHLLKCTKYSTPALNDEILNKIWSCDESEEVTRALQKIAQSVNQRLSERDNSDSESEVDREDWCQEARPMELVPSKDN